MNMTTIMSMKRIEVFGPNTSKVKVDKDGKYANVAQKWQGSKKNRVQIIIGQQEVPSECLEWPMIKAMVNLKLITVGKTTAVKQTAEEKQAEKAAKAEVLAAKKLAEAAKKPAPEPKLPKVKKVAPKK